MRRIYNADVDRFTRVSAARMTAGLVPTLKAQATVAGTTQPGQVLSANRGTWTGDQLAFDYQWQRCDSAGAGCSRILGAAAATYTVTAGDLASTLRVDGGRSESPRLRDLELRGHNGRSRPARVADGNGRARWLRERPGGRGAHRRRGWLGCRPDRTRLPVAAL